MKRGVASAMLVGLVSASDQVNIKVTVTSKVTVTFINVGGLYVYKRNNSKYERG